MQFYAIYKTTKILYTKFVNYLIKVDLALSLTKSINFNKNYLKNSKKTFYKNFFQ